MAKPKFKVGELVMQEGKRATPYGTYPKIIWRGLPLMKAKIGLTGTVISVAAANDYGGTQIADLPNTNMLIAGFMIDAVGTLSAGLVGTSLTVSLGSAVAAATPLASTAIDYLEAVTATGSSVTATIKGHSFDNTTPVWTFKDATSGLKLFVNGAIAISAGTGTLTFTSGQVEMFYFDLDEVS